MGKTRGGSWLGLMKKAFRSPIKENNQMRSSRRREEAEQEEEEEEKKRGKRRWIFRKPTLHETTLIHHNQEVVATTTNTSSNRGGATLDKERSGVHPSSKHHVEYKAQATVDIIQLTRPTVLVKQLRAIVIIQSAFRGYLARKALGALKGLVKLQALIRGHNVRKQAKMTLQCMQSLVRVQTQVCDQRRRLSYEGIRCGSPMLREPKSIMELHLSSDKEYSNSTNQASTVDNGDDHLHALEKIEALLQKVKKEAAKKRENTLAHAFSHKMWNSNKDDEEASSSTSTTTRGIDETSRRVFHRTNVKNYSKTPNRYSCEYQPRDCIKNIEMDMACSYNSDSDAEFSRLHHQYYQQQQQKFYSVLGRMPPVTPPLKMNNNIGLAHSASPRCKKEEKSHQYRNMALLSHRANGLMISRNVSADHHHHQPNYMAATASASARARRERSQSAPRQMPMTPEREKTSGAKKRLSFPVQ